MHKTTTRLLLIFIAGLFTLSCDKKKEEISPASKLEYKGKTYDLSQGLWSSLIFDKEDLEELSLLLTTSSLKAKYVNGKFDSIDGTITGVILYVYMKKGTKGLDAGEYMSNINGAIKPNSVYGIIIINGDADTFESNEKAYLETTKMTVKKNGSIYEITLEATDVNGKAVKGFYKGELKSIE